MGESLQSILNLVDPYTLQILVNIGIAIVLALGLNVITGITGQLSLGHAAFMSIGAFTSAVITLRTGLPFSANLLLSGLATAFVGAAIGYPILRLTGDYLAICTLGFAEIVKVVFLNLDITNKALGLSVPPARSPIPMPIIVWVVAILAIIFVSFMKESRFGRALKAIRDDEIAAEAMGINIARYKVQSFAVGSFLAGVGGCLYAHFLSYINPSDFGFLKSVDILSMVVLGGSAASPAPCSGHPSWRRRRSSSASCPSTGCSSTADCSSFSWSSVPTACSAGSTSPTWCCGPSAASLPRRKSTNGIENKRIGEVPCRF